MVLHKRIVDVLHEAIDQESVKVDLAKKRLYTMQSQSMALLEQIHKSSRNCLEISQVRVLLLFLANFVN